MLKTIMYKCPVCNAILCLPKTCLRKATICPSCDRVMIELDEGFDLSEIVEEDKK